MAQNTKKTIAAVEEVDAIDFDAWTEEDEAAVLAALAGAHAIKYVISEKKSFIGRFPDGRIIRTPLMISVEDLEMLDAMKLESELDQLKQLLTLLGKDEEYEYLKAADLASSMDYAMKYFRVFEKLIHMTMGEFEG